MTGSRADTTLPQNLQAEEKLLGALLLGAAMPSPALERAVALVEPEHFFRPSHGALYSGIRATQLEGQPPEPLIVVEQLRRLGQLERAGGEQRVLELSHLASATGNADHYAKLVRDTWEKRLLARALTDAQTVARNGVGAEDALAAAERAIVEVRERTARGRSSVMTSYQAAEWYEQKLQHPHEEGRGIATPFPRLPRMQASRLYVLAGFTAHGKSSLAVQYLRSACSDGARVGFVTVEMSRFDLIDRIVSCYGVPYDRAQSGHAGDYRPLAEHAIAEMARFQFEIIDDESLQPAALQRYQQTGRYGLLIIDHLHRFDWSERRQLEQHIRTITNLAKRFEIPVLLLAQLRREGNDFPRPTLSSLRETGILEQEAAMVTFVWRKTDPLRKLPTNEAELIVAKNRFGRTSAFDLSFRPEEVRFVMTGEA